MFPYMTCFHVIGWLYISSHVLEPWISQVRGRRPSQLPLDRPQNSQESLHQAGSVRKSHRRKGKPSVTSRHVHTGVTSFLLFETRSCRQTEILFISSLLIQTSLYPVSRLSHVLASLIWDLSVSSTFSWRSFSFTLSQNLTAFIFFPARHISISSLPS